MAEEIVNELDFNRGRDLALAMLAAGDDLRKGDPDGSGHYRWWRNGAPQVRFTAQYVRALCAEPALISGFDAVLSAKLVDEGFGFSGEYALPMAEYEAGTVGADGTQPEQ